MNFSIKAVVDCALKVQFEQDVTPKINGKIKGFCKRISELNLDGIVEWVPAYDSITIYYLPFKLTYHDLYGKLSNMNISDAGNGIEKQRIINVQVVYGG